MTKVGIFKSGWPNFDPGLRVVYRLVMQSSTMLRCVRSIAPWQPHISIDQSIEKSLTDHS